MRGLDPRIIDGVSPHMDGRVKPGQDGLRVPSQAAQKAVQSSLAFARLARANFMHRRRIDSLIGNDPPPRTDPKQMVLQWA